MGKQEGSKTTSSAAAINGSNNLDEYGNDDPNAPLTDEQVLDGLHNLADSLKSLDDSRSSPQLSHYRSSSASSSAAAAATTTTTTTLPESVTTAYQLMSDGANLVHATSTKYTLMGKIDHAEQNKFVRDLLRGCQLVSTGCLVLHQDSTGCCRSVRHTSKQSSRAIVQTVLQLVESFVATVDGSALLSEGQRKEDNQVGAQKTGAVWQACDYVLEKKMPVGNRNAMRRDLFTYVKECNETICEFQELIDAGPTMREEVGGEDEEGGDGGGGSKGEVGGDDGCDDDQLWEMFLSGQDEQQYTAEEIPVAAACVGLIKSSRGSLNALLKSCDEIGQLLSLTSTTPEGGGDGSAGGNCCSSSSISALSREDKLRLQWISRAFDAGHGVGEGMTDLGATLYPPLKLQAISRQVTKQSAAIEDLLHIILNSSRRNLEQDRGEESIIEDDVLPQFSEEVTELATKVLAAVRRRKGEAEVAISSATQNSNE